MSVERLQAAGAQILSYFSSKYSHLYQSHPWLTLIGSAIISYNLYASLLEKLRLPNLNKRAVFITGCDFGMGRVAAIELAKLGVPVFAGCLSDEAIVSIEQESVKLKGEIIGVKCDITSDDDVRNAVETVRSHLKNGVKLWAVINNAGVFSTFGPAEWCSVDVYKKAMELNFYGAVRVSNAFLPLIRESHGRISVTTSVAARIGIMGGSPYSCAKVALNHFAEAANVENRVFGVYFGIIEPGIFKTTLLDNEAKRKRVNSVWETLDPSIKEVYGEEYKEKFIDDWNKVMNDQGSADISPVIWSYVHFVTARYPRFRYQAGANSKWLWGKLALLPSNWFHRLVPTISGEPLVPAYMQPKKEL
ncbi:unnamed protein product [Bursaphelenchus xylophilus]|uniref:(pine wood nematode) hypothetical protein n=1 Tax=Bursaphelenchus xylophilus TaxID=6326 RepID=A0A1I7RXT9_BURXY|nr:unnamed protein product [Bursaphelenchus xylophilus]CAG9125155.1 unnamed protein product [Bursaphelenchus xylophilus]